MPLKVTFPRWGNYTLAFDLLARKLGFDVLLPEKTNPRAILEGAKISPEMYCFPFKVNLGNYLSAIEKGANTILMATASGGSCRLRYYGVVQEKILKEMGKDVHFITFDQAPKDIYLKIKELSGKSFFEILKIFFNFWQNLKLIEKMENLACYLRPREIKIGETDRVFLNCLEELKRASQNGDWSGLKRKVFKEFSKIKIENKKNLPKVGIIGEIFTVCDPEVNFEIEKKMGQSGIEVHREMDLTYHLKKKIFPWKDWLIQRKINPYLKSTVGGHGRDAIYEMLNYVKEGFDGVIQLLPAMCMPEVTVRPILEKIHQESGIPFLSLSIDEQVAETGVDTRLEAFLDVVKNYHQKKKLTA
jgi:predicted nucleotide-binding protein (sugar kinase/HSP70/actin superfamily)